MPHHRPAARITTHLVVAATPLLVATLMSTTAVWAPAHAQGLVEPSVPTVTAVSPAADAGGVAIGDSVMATFSEPVQGVDGTSFTLRADGASTDVAAVVTYDVPAGIATLDPAADLEPSTRYTAALTGGPSAIRDLEGNVLADLSWTFTTATPALPAATPAAPPVTSPAGDATGVPVADNVTATFAEPVEGLDGASFTLRADGATTDVAATVTHDATTGVVTLDPAADLEANTRYTATLTALRGTTGNPLPTTSWSFTTGGPATPSV